MKNMITFILLLTFLSACIPETAVPELVQTTQPLELIQETVAQTPVFYPTMNEKVLIVSQGNYYLANPDGSESVNLYSGGQEPLTTASLSPDRTKFAYYKNNFLYVLDIPGQTTVVLNREIIGSIGGNLRWSPNGSKLAMTCSTAPHPSNAICQIDAQSRQIEFLLKQKDVDQFCSGNYMELLDWSKDGTTMVYTCFIVPEKGQKQTFALYLYDLASKASSRVFDSSSQDSIWYLHSASLSPRKDNLLVSGANQAPVDQVFLLDLTTNELKQLTSGSEYHSDAFAWRSDSESFYLHKTLVLSPYTESNFVMNTNGEVLFQIEIIGAIIE
ncbi:MAG: hypothetical protein JETCAE02_18880 [Anaerolineaceae bacterium]|nr:hypothetical protein [Chloroflexota bacterium]MDL1925605.1 hypothetical protein [Anaerolineae bacterium AMX1]WKZ52224.1 MAG: hypothetical protein QY329_05715 [Anaerolineales bacterium]GJQ39476.1 MAG: hypothetical protein JETCAE02_18880 [Anaerolineaceae bacterium]NOG76729.1 hypothetical protein [Chloroflexota bacterium]